MKIYRIAQDQQAALEEVVEAMTKINASIAAINQALKTLEQTNVLNLFQRNNLIAAVQSGNVAALDIDNINRALTAMHTIAQTVPVINASLRVLKDNEAIAKSMNMDFNMIQATMIASLQKGDFQQFTSMLSGFKTGLPAMSGTQTY